MEISFRNRKARAFFLGDKKAKCPNEDVNNIRRPICWDCGNGFSWRLLEIMQKSSWITSGILKTNQIPMTQNENWT